jgi:hypothetical protein
VLEPSNRLNWLAESTLISSGFLFHPVHAVTHGGEVEESFKRSTGSAGFDFSEIQ